MDETPTSFNVDMEPDLVEAKMEKDDADILESDSNKENMAAINGMAVIAENGDNGEVITNGEARDNERQAPKSGIPRARRSSLDLSKDDNKRKVASKTIHKQASLDNRKTNNNKKQARSTSLWNISSHNAHHPPVSPRENLASIRRKQMIQTKCASVAAAAALEAEKMSETYMTPSQRKDQTIRDLKNEITTNNERLRDRERQIQEMVSKTHADLSHILIAKDNENHQLRDELSLLNSENDELLAQREFLTEERNELKRQLDAYQEEHYQQEEKNRELFLMMFEKGKKSADFVRQDTLEEIAKTDPTAVSVNELLDKLSATQAQLAELQCTTREQSYQDASLLTPTADSEVTLRCTRDALFQYLTAPDQKTKKQHLSILLSLSGFTGPQRKKIDKCTLKSKSQT